MGDVASFLNNNAGAVQSLFAAVVAVATVVYVFYTARMFNQMRRSNERLEAANVQALLQPGRSRGSLFELTVKNSGSVPVYDIRVDVDPEDFEGLGGPLGDLSLFKRSIPVLTEGQEIRTVLFDYLDYANSKERGNTILFRVSYKNVRDVEESRTYTYDLDVYMGLTDFTERGLNDVAKQLQNLNKRIKKVSSGVEKISRRLEWSSMLFPTRFGDHTSLPEVLVMFLSYWKDFKALGDRAFVGFSMHKMRALCQEVHDELCRYEETADVLELRQGLLGMARKEFHLDGGKTVQEFVALGDEVAEKMRQMQVAESGEV